MSTEGIAIREFRPGDEAAFRELNEEWIRRYFVLEEKDEAAFADPQTTILQGGGRIFLAECEERCIGCCALLRTGAAEFEVAKMAVTALAQGQGVGRTLLQHTVEEARRAGATRLYLETNHSLTSAIHLYEALGFRRMSPERVVPSPYARADVFMEKLLWR